MHEWPADSINIEGTGILHQLGGWAFCTNQLLLPGCCQFELQAEGIGPELVVPQIPDLLSKQEVSCTRVNQTHIEGVWKAWSKRNEEPAVSTSMTKVQLTRRLEKRTHIKRWTMVGLTCGLLLTATPTGLGLSKRRQIACHTNQMPEQRNGDQTRVGTTA